MYSKKFCIQTLTHNSPTASGYLLLTVEQFIKNTTISDSIKNYNGKVDWYIRLNGSNSEIEQAVKQLLNVYKNEIDWHILRGENIGVGAGINYLNEQCRDYEYVLFIEGDWICLDTEVSGISKDWLAASIEILDRTPSVDQVFLRRHTSDIEDRQFGMSDWFNKDRNISIITEQGVPFLHLNKGIYTNNPTVKRLSSYFKAGIFPLNEYYDQDGNPTEIKVYSSNEVNMHTDWGQAEIIANNLPTDMKTFWLWPGVFNHESVITKEMINIPCNQCKYGFFSPSEWFCLSCSTDNRFFELSDHTNRGLETVMDLVDEKQINSSNSKEITKIIKELVKNPTNPPETTIQHFYKNTL